MQEDIQLVAPKLEKDAREVVVRRWFFKEGEFVPKNSPIAEVATQNFSLDLTLPQPTYVKRMLVKQGDTTLAGGTIAQMSLKEPKAEYGYHQSSKSQTDFVQTGFKKDIPSYVSWITTEIDLDGVLQCQREAKNSLATTKTPFEILPFLVHEVGLAIKANPISKLNYAEGAEGLRYRGGVDLEVNFGFDDMFKRIVLRDLEKEGVIPVSKMLKALLIESTSNEYLSTSHLEKTPFRMQYIAGNDILSGVLEPTINEVLVLNFGSVKNRVLAINGTVTHGFFIRPIVNVCMSYRTNFFGYLKASKFLQTLKSRLEIYSKHTNLT